VSITFTAARDEQTGWLRDHARQACTIGTTKAFVVTAVGSDAVVAYHAWCMARTLQ
jgi:hypothetical protein